MRPFEVDGSKYVRINGKSFYLLRGYKIRYDKFIFVQVFGRAALTKDDLPEKNWELVSTKGAEGRVYTAWKPGFFDGSNETRLFLGATKEASLRLLLAARAPQLDIGRAMTAAFHPDDETFSGGRLKYDLGVTAYEDEGNSGVPAYSVEQPYKFQAWLATLTEAPCPTH